MPMRDIEELEEAELRLKYERGDYIDAKEIKQIDRLLQKYEKERNFKEACEKAAVSAALTANNQAKTSTVIAVIALALSLASLLWQIYGNGGQP